MRELVAHGHQCYKMLPERGPVGEYVGHILSTISTQNQ